MTYEELPDLVVGQKYRIVAAIPGVWVTPREQVGTFLEVRREPGRRPRFMFHLHPLAGTQDLPLECLISVEPTHGAATLPRKVRSQT
jgi:hypothetical protein